MKNKAIFLDRDGTLNEDTGYLGDPKELVLFPGVAEALSLLKNKYDFKLFVVSNQSGIARGLITEQDVIAVNKELNKTLSFYNVQIDAFYYCPFHPDFNTEKECECRKPSPKMILDCVKENNIDISISYLIGDTVADIESGISAGVKSILVKTGRGVESISMLQKGNNFPSFIAENLTEACNYIIKDSFGDTISAK
ncbi:MAG: HAD family hydrolase [Ignavibacteriaceae bacterium]